MEIYETKLPGCYELQPKVFKDHRGTFVKTFHEEVFKKYQLNINFAEEYYSFSHQNVFRGLHFQMPPKDHTKMVYCVQGEVIDAVVDLRVGSPTYGKCETFSLTAEKANIIYIPPGFAHGFYVLSETAIMMYKVSTVYSPEQDTGIHWNSVGVVWPIPNPIVSKRDNEFVALSDFNSPFVY
ncbi:dTDP-4-dehydrorhamnose 3,5-epimerase [Microcoleus sp. AT9_A2]|uniref:dTDP-4-dehydrorhamnose 3,5-epimerase n=1 Tax=Microcoleus sp. AT9_A2 TaxID=2818624 RepID=UPI002FCEBA18